MINMMMDILQYLPYALLIGFVALLLGAGVYATISYFRGYEKNPARHKPVKLVEKYKNFFGPAVK